MNLTDAQLKEMREQHKIDIEKSKKSNQMQQAMKRAIMKKLE